MGHKRECKYCNEDAVINSYRDNNGCVSSETTCILCQNLTTEVLSLKIHPQNIEEGDDYWVIETVKGVTHLLNSCGDEQTQDINNKDSFRTLDDGLKYLHIIGSNNVRISNMYTDKIFDIEIKKVI